MDKFISTCEAIISRYEQVKISLPNPKIKNALKQFKKKYKKIHIVSYYEENRDSLIANAHYFLMDKKSAIIANKDSFIAMTNIYKLADELMESTKKIYSIMEVDADTYVKHPDLKLPITFLIDMWKMFLSFLSTENRDYETIKNKIEELELRTQKKNEPKLSPQEDDELKKIIDKVANAVKDPSVSQMFTETIKSVDPNDIGKSLPKIYEMVSNEKFKSMLTQ